MSSEGIQHLSSVDPVLHKIIDRVSPPEPVVPNSVFHDLIACVIEQQIPYRSTKHIFEKRLEKAEIQKLTPANFEIFEERGLVGLKISGNKTETISRILESWSDMPENWGEISDDEVRNALKSIKGIGPWTIDMILLYTLQRPDIFPADDYHLKQLMPELYGLNPRLRLKAQMKEVAEKWSPHKSLAVRVMLDWKKLKGDLGAINER